MSGHLVAQVREAINMAPSLDMSLIQQGTRLRRSPYFNATQRYGCRAYTVYNHMFLPGHYDDPVTEYWHLINHVAVWDVAVERQVEITGPDAFAFTNMLTPRDLTKCRVGQGRYVVITAEDGGIINDPVLMRLGENHFWLALADSDVLLWARGVAVHADLDVNLLEPDVSPLQVQGPKSKQVVKALFGERITELPYYQFLEASLDGIPLIVTRTGWTGEVGYEIYLKDPTRGSDLWEKVMAAGKAAMSFNWSWANLTFEDPKVSVIAGKYGMAINPADADDPEKKYSCAAPVAEGLGSIPVKSANKEWAWKFIEEYLSRDAQLFCVKELGLTPVRRDVFDDPETKKWPIFALNREQLEKYPSDEIHSLSPHGVDFVVMRAFSEHFHPAIQGKVPVKDALNRAADVVAKAITRAKRRG